MDEHRLFSGIDNSNSNDTQNLIIKHSRPVLKNNESTHTHLLNTLGVSKRLGSSVLDELDTRTNEKFEQLLVSNNDHYIEPMTELTFSERFNIAHDSQFKTMESLDTHYSVKYSNSDEDYGNDDNIYKTPSKRNFQPDEIQSNSIKRLRIAQNLLNTPSPILDVTRGIRRLRLRSSLTSNDGSSSGGNISSLGTRDTHDSRSIVNSKIKNTRITKPQNLLEPPSFLKPTVTSLNRMKRSEKMNDLNSKIKPQKSRVLTTCNNQTTNNNSSSSNGGRSMNSLIRGKQKENVNKEGSGRRVKSTGNTVSNSNESLSVFERLYKQSTVSRSVSRSVSMNNVTSNSYSDKNEKNTKRNLENNSHGIKFGRSKTTSGISDHITVNKNSNTFIKTRPAWR